MAKRTSGNGWPSSTAQKAPGCEFNRFLAFRQVAAPSWLGFYPSWRRGHSRHGEASSPAFKRDEEALGTLSQDAVWCEGTQGGLRAAGRQVPEVEGSGGRNQTGRNLLSHSFPKTVQGLSDCSPGARNSRTNGSSEIFCRNPLVGSRQDWLNARPRGLYQKTGRPPSPNISSRNSESSVKAAEAATFDPQAGGAGSNSRTEGGVARSRLFSSSHRGRPCALRRGEAEGRSRPYVRDQASEASNPSYSLPAPRCAP